MNTESNNISRSWRKEPFPGEKGPVMWQSRLFVTVSFLCKGSTV